MPNLASIVASINAARRRRTPRMVRVQQDGTTSLSVVFDRDMDQTKTNALIRTYDPINGAIDWTGGTWKNRRIFRSITSNFVTTFTGTRRAVYLSGSLRAKGRYRVDLRNRCDRIVDG